MIFCSNTISIFHFQFGKIRIYHKIIVFRLVYHVINAPNIAQLFKFSTEALFFKFLIEFLSTFDSFAYDNYYFYCKLCVRECVCGCVCWSSLIAFEYCFCFFSVQFIAFCDFSRNLLLFTLLICLPIMCLLYETIFRRNSVAHQKKQNKITHKHTKQSFFGTNEFYWFHSNCIWYIWLYFVDIVRILCDRFAIMIQTIHVGCVAFTECLIFLSFAFFIQFFYSSIRANKWNILLHLSNSILILKNSQFDCVFQITVNYLKLTALENVFTTIDQSKKSVKKKV